MEMGCNGSCGIQPGTPEGSLPNSDICPGGERHTLSCHCQLLIKMEWYVMSEYTEFSLSPPQSKEESSLQSVEENKN